MRSERRTVRLEITWNDETLPGVVPPEVWRADPLAISEAPTAERLAVTVVNPARGAFAGSLLVRAGEREGDGQPVHLRPGEGHVHVLLPKITETHQIELRDEGGKLVAQTARSRFEKMTGFPIQPGSATEMESTLFVDNRAQPPHPLNLVAAGAQAPAPFALEIPYRFDPGWRYLGVSFQKAVTIPARAKAAILWVRGNHSGDALRCRFRDATGQTFQPDVARLDWTDWRPLHIDLTARPGTGHWGGADDGIPHPPLTWESLLLIDSARQQKPKPQTILAASPCYQVEE